MMNKLQELPKDLHYRNIKVRRQIVNSINSKDMASAPLLFISSLQTSLPSSIQFLQHNQKNYSFLQTHIHICMEYLVDVTHLLSIVSRSTNPV